MHSAVIAVEDPASFLITSDTPVVLYDAGHDPKSPYGRGFAHKTIDVTIPLTSRIALCFHHIDDIPESISAAHARNLNARMIVSADRFVYSPKPCPDLIKEVSRLHAQESGFKSSTLDYGDGAVFVSKMVPVTDSHLNAGSEQDGDAKRD